jgi:hypothetical protein
MSQAKLNGTAVGTKYQKTFGDGSSTPWLDDNEELQKRIKANKWMRWTGDEGTVEDHATWIHEQAKSLMSDERRDEFRPYGKKRGFQYFIHDELTADADGCGFFKIEGTLQLEPRELLAFVFDSESIANADKTVIMMKVIATYLGKEKGDPFNAVVYWANDPGFPFNVRDGLDLTGYKKDEDGTVWQFATALSGDYFASQPKGVTSIDRYFSYKMEPNGDGTTKTTMICQTILNGWIPKVLSNAMICNVLIDYMATIEAQVKERKASGEHQKMIKQLELV